MIANLLRNQPGLNQRAGTRLTISGDRQSVRNLAHVDGVRHLYILSIQQSEFDYLVNRYNTAFESICFKSMKVADLSALELLHNVKTLVLDCNTRAKRLWDLSRNYDLRELSISNFPGLNTLGDLREATSVEALELGGGAEKWMRVQSLAPLSNLIRLRKLCLSNIRAVEDGLLPLASLTHLDELELPNVFPTREYAMLSVRLQNTRCDSFAPYIRLGTEIDGKDCMVVGRRKPLLNSTVNAERLNRYAKEFEDMRQEFL
ncbi:MAG TPA: hypothetical protein P5309_10915 [Syntrophomonadaceae bacterium]|nr:hypothetical protein [Syntrophomonadaceae bacterium]